MLSSTTKSQLILTKTESDKESSLTGSVMWVIKFKLSSHEFYNSPFKKKLFLSREILLLVYFHSIFCGFFHLFNAFSSLNTFILCLDFLTFSNRLPLLVTSPPGFKYPYNTLFTHSSNSCPSVCWHTQMSL